MPKLGSVSRVVVLAGLVLTAVLFSTGAADPVNVVKVTVLVLCAVALIALAAVAVIARRQLQLPSGAHVAAAVLLLVAFAVAAARSPTATSAVLGSYGRNSGLLAYAAAIVLFFSVLCAFDRAATRLVLFGLMTAGALTASYGLLQYAGADPLEWSDRNPVVATLGNPNFVAGYLAICTPAFAWGSLRPLWRLHWRVLCAIGAALCALVALLTMSFQGPLAVAAGVAVLAAAWLLDQSARVRRGGIAAVALVAASGVALLGWGVAGGGPAAGSLDDTGTRARGWFWETAFAAWRDNPVLGIGLERFAPYWLQNRPLDAIRGLGGEDVTDAAHNVPLHLLATGGVVLFLAYAGFVTVTLWFLIRGLRDLRQQERLLLGALGGCWTAYQVQSFVSIDQVPLLVTHYVLAGAIVVAAGGARTRLVRLPGAARPVPARGSRRAPAAQGRTREVTAGDRALLGAVGAVALGLAWVALLPLRADIAARTGDIAVGRGEGTPGLVAYERATELLPGQPRYWERLGRLLLTADRPEEALDAYRRGIEADPASVPVVRGAARAAAEAGDLRAAQAYHSRALELHPNSPRTVIAAAEFALQQDDAETAERLIDDALQALPEEASLWVARGQLLAAAGDVEGAREALQRALALDDQAPGAAEGLRSLDADAS